MIKNVVKFQVQIADRSYQLFVEQDSPLGDIKEALFQFHKDVGQVEDNIRVMQEKAKEEEAAKSEKAKEETKAE